MAKQSDIYIDYEKFKLGIYALEDTTKAPFGSARLMRNMTVTDRGGVAPRMGTSLLGSSNSAAKSTLGFYNFRKSYDSDEFLIKTYDDEMEVYSKNHSSAGWWRLKSGFTAEKEFGFVTSLVNTLNEDFCIFCNRYDNYQRWQGSVTLLNGALAGGESSVVVDSVLTEEIFYTGTATGSSTTTLDVSGTPWANDMWIGMYVYITSGAQAGQIRLISDNDNNTLTFASMTDPGNADFQIRKAAFPASGTIIYGGTTIAYSAIPEYNKFTVSSAHAGSDNAAVALVPTEYPENPRGNRLTNYLARIIVGNVRSALARDSGGALSGFASAGSYFVSKLANPFDFTYTATRVAGEGDIISTPYGGGDITDVAHQEDTAYIFKKRYIESVKYSQDANDLANRTPLKAEVGSVGPVIKGSDDIYFVTEDKKFTSLGRVASKDVLPQTDNIGHSIQRLLNTYVFGTGRGIEDVDRIYIPCKSSSSETNNDIVLVYNKKNKSFEGIWELHANFFQRFNGNLYFAESNTPNVFQMNTGHADIVGTDRFPISAEYASNFMNLTASHGYSQSMNSMYFEGYIKDGTVITFKAWKDFSDDAFLEFDFGSEDESNFLDGSEISGFLGSAPIGLRPMGSVDSNPDSDGRRHFQFRVYFPFQYGNHFSVGFSSSGAEYDYEVTRIGIGLSESVSVDTGRIKSI